MSNILSSLGLPTVGVAVIVICFIIKYYNNVRVFINDVFHFIAKIFRIGRRSSIKGDIQLFANMSIKELNNTVPELQLPDMKIEWVKEDSDGQVRFDDSKAIVMLKFNTDRTQNVINSTSAYIHNTLLTTSRLFMDEPIVKAIDFTIIQKFLKHTPEKRFAIRKFVQANIQDVTQYQDSFDKVNKTDQQGLLSHILLREYTTWGDSIVTELPSDDHRRESREILDFVYDIASRGYDELTPLQLNKTNVKIAVLLVAKTETYNEKGSRPYLRRIREGFASGINTFYLLARGDKIDILRKVYGELIQTGNFTLLNNPEVFLDKEGRENICYCLEVDKSGAMATDVAEINKAIGNLSEIELSIVHVHRDELKCLYNGRLQVSIPVEEICDHNIRLRNFYTAGMTISAIPLSFGDGGIVKASLIDTNSNPQKLIENEYAVGNTVKAIVQEAEDDVVRFLISGSDIQAFAFRKDLTYSNYLFLHKLYPVGQEFECEIIGIDYVSNQLRLSRKDLVDPWSICDIKVGDLINVTIYKIEETYFASEINEGLKIILPYSELSWLKSEIDKEKKRIKLNTELKLRVKDVDTDRRIIIASHKPLQNPYQQLFDSLGNEKLAKVKLLKSDSYGISGIIGELNVFIPISETHRADNHFNYKIGKEYDTFIKSVADDGRCLIGSFIPFIKHPLSEFENNYTKGDLIKSFTITRVDKFLYLLKLNNKKYDKCRLCLHVSEVSNIAFINEFEKIGSLIKNAPLTIKKIDHDRNCVELSLKSTLLKNNDKRNDMDYESSYRGVIVGSRNDKYIVIILNHWLEGYLDTSKVHRSGEEISVRLSAHGSEYAEFYED